MRAEGTQAGGEAPLVVAVTGASGVIYALRLLEVLLTSGRRVCLTISPSGREVLEQELKIRVDLQDFQPAALTRREGICGRGSETDWDRVIAAMLRGLGQAIERMSGQPDAFRYYHYQDYLAPLASGSFLTGGMVICPCSGSTLSAVVHGASNNLIQRAADVHLKERRKLILVPRETPLSTIQLGNLQQASAAGAVVLPAMPGWYHGVRSLGDLIDFIVARVLDQLCVEHTLVRRWGPCSDR